ncbi:HDOD domain-containing protein [Shewanella maritima]|uniref:HDOD domain-containing protein n=1 Tax=Shewanella maritima TaxID=2520507 RepID=UPI0037356D87
MESSALLGRVDELPRLPKAVSELLDAVNDESTSIKAISQKVSLDPLISARVLRLANSAHFGRSREVGSIEEAVVRLGMQTLRTLVVASAVVGAIPNVQGVDLAKFWGETFEISLYAQEMAKRADVAPDEVFTCGILHRIGDLLIATVEPAINSQIVAAVEAGGNKQELEMALLGFDSPAVGALLAESWKFTHALVAGIKYQLEPMKAQGESKIASMIFLAHQVYSFWDDNRGEDSFTCWLSTQADKVGIIKMDMDGITDKLIEIRGKGLEIGKQLA